VAASTFQVLYRRTAEERFRPFMMKISPWLRHLGLAPGRSAQQRDTSLRREVRNLTTQSMVACCVEVADRGPARTRGLLGRQSLGKGEGLWIVPCEAVHTFGMRFAIDLVFLDRRNVVRKVRSSVRPWRLSGCLRAHSVIELAAGTLKSTPVHPGDTLHFSPAPPFPSDAPLISS
jgi:uncharacterized membrane protein (UPF0127 family)